MENNLDRWSKPFKTSEATPVIIEDINGLIEKHDRDMELLFAIGALESRRDCEIENVNGFGGTFPELREKSINRIDTLNRAINRLLTRYFTKR